MKVLYDYQILLNQRFGGISRYYYELIDTCNQYKILESEIHCIFNVNHYFEHYFKKTAKAYYWKLKGKKILNKMLYKVRLKMGQYDIFHPTYYDPYFLNDYKGKLVITIYDMIHEIFPNQSTNSEMIVTWKKVLIDKADHVIAISNSTKKDILHFYPDIPEWKISVIYIASNFKKRYDEQANYEFPPKYILFVGNREKYKNYHMFFESVKTILKNDNQLYLVCVGGGKFSSNENTLHGEVRDQIIQMDVTDEILSFAYSHAECFVFPSLYEGFGIPILEAFACDCPVILSNTSSMPEVGGDAAVYMNPMDTQDITQKIKMVLNNDTLKENMRQKGRVQLKKFNWKKIAYQTADCYQQVLKGQ